MGTLPETLRAQFKSRCGQDNTITPLDITILAILIMGVNRLPKKEDNPNEIPERNDEEAEDNDADLSEDSEPESPPPSPTHIKRMRALNEERVRLEQEAQECNVNSQKLNEVAESMKHHVEAIERELKRIKSKYAEDLKNGITGVSSGIAVHGGSGMVLVAAGGSGMSSAGIGEASTPRTGNEEIRGNTPLDVVAREIQRVADEIELTAGLTSTSSVEEDKEEVDEPVKKKEKSEENKEEDRDRDDGSPPMSNA